MGCGVLLFLSFPLTSGTNYFLRGEDKAKSITLKCELIKYSSMSKKLKVTQVRAPSSPVCSPSQIVGRGEIEWGRMATEAG